ncbi:MAG TPA: hypothetical protein VKA95_04010 [Nitrososphaeraceae archaeon]|nr:hypothetical protein [Nitrososphaeraceae archaeon]
MQTKNFRLIFPVVAVVMILLTFAATFKINPILAETGKGDDVFKVIMTIFGVDRSKGDLIAVVTTNNGEASRVKFLDSEAPYVVPLNASAADSELLVEYVATFPNVTVNAGEEYKACVMTTKDLNPICSTGQNSPASRPEFIDISLNADTQQETTEEGDAIENNDED